MASCFSSAGVYWSALFNVAIWSGTMDRFYPCIFFWNLWIAPKNSQSRINGRFVIRGCDSHTYCSCLCYHFGHSRIRSLFLYWSTDGCIAHRSGCDNRSTLTTLCPWCTEDSVFDGWLFAIYCTDWSIARRRVFLQRTVYQNTCDFIWFCVGGDNHIFDFELFALQKAIERIILSPVTLPLQTGYSNR